MYEATRMRVEQDSAAAVNTEFEPITEEEAQQITAYASSVQVAFKQESPEFGFNPPSVKLLSDSITAGRQGYTQEQRIKIANLFGAFCGQAMISFNKGVASRWIKSKGDFGIVFTRGQKQWVVFPINRVFRHIDDGAEFSTYEFFMAMHEFLRSHTA